MRGTGPSSILVGLLLASCASSIPETEHRAALRDQQQDYERRMLRADEQRRDAEARLLEERERGEAGRDAMRERVQRLEDALANKEHLLDAALMGSGSRRATWTLPKGLRAAVLAAAGEGASFETRGREAVLTLPSDTLFELGSTAPSPEGEARWQKLGDAIRGFARVGVQVVVHTDGIRPAPGSPDLWEISARQGSALVRRWTEGGFDPARLSLAAYGPFRPRADNDGPTGRAENRRIEVRLYAMGELDIPPSGP